MNGNEFELEVELDPVDAIMAVSPDSLVDLSEFYTFWIINKGVEILFWEIGSVISDPEAEEFNLDFEPSDGFLLPDSSVPVRIYSERYDIPVTYTVIIESQVGHVELNLRTDNILPSRSRSAFRSVEPAVSEIIKQRRKLIKHLVGQRL
ncbi:MAG: hypothetical protein U5K69_28550 [Balneolaceae bacterium]|nr:hypothetical protein [Balneolaceae bacterium]